MFVVISQLCEGLASVIHEPGVLIGVATQVLAFMNEMVKFESSRAALKAQTTTYRAG